MQRTQWSAHGYNEMFVRVLHLLQRYCYLHFII